jgi:hypothetical protein
MGGEATGGRRDRADDGGEFRVYGLYSERFVGF